MRTREPRYAARACARALFALAVTALSAAGGGCELAVPDTVPAFTCVPAAGSCPGDEVCDPVTMQCVPPAHPVGPDAQACTQVGCDCSGPSDCASGICGDQLTVTTDVYKAASDASFCTRPCCTSADCDASSVCFATAAGGSYCVLPAWLGRSTALGTGRGGAPCGVDSDCRSGICAGQACADTCCSTAHAQADCSPGATCAFGAFPGKSFDVHYTAYCAPASGAGANGASCTGNGQCLAALCAVGTCHDACRSSTDCGSTSEECAYAILPSFAIVTACATSPGSGEEGTSCQSDAACQSGFCDAASGLCTDVCFADTDCTADGWRCRPEMMALPGGASYSVLACGG